MGQSSLGFEDGSLMLTSLTDTPVTWNVSHFLDPLILFNLSLWIQEVYLPSATKLRRLCFYRCLSTGWGGGGANPACLAGFQAHTQGGKFRGICRGGVSRSTAKGEVERGQVQAHSQGGSRLRPPPPSRQLLLRMVCILLECILVLKENISGFHVEAYVKSTGKIIPDAWLP